MEYFKSLSQLDLIAIIESTQKALYLCLPSLHEEIATSISKLDHFRNFQNKDIGIHILIDFDAQTFRQGYGDHQAVDSLLKGGFDIKTLADNRISFIISDSTGYYLFIESRSLIPADKATINAVKIDPVSIVRLKSFFFNSAQEVDFEDELTNAIIEESKQLEKSSELLINNTASVSEISSEEIESVSKDINSNPPLNPNFKRIVEFYSNRFQYVKLKFEGSNIQHRKIEIPPKALPIADASLKERLETKLNLFDPATIDKSFEGLLELKDKVSTIRDQYLTKVKSREESLLNKLDKTNFVNSIQSLQAAIKAVKISTLTTISKKITETKNSLLVDLTEFLKANPKTLFPDQPHLWQENLEYIHQSAISKSEKIVHRIPWPEAHTLVEEFKLDVQFSDITFEDLRNRKFIGELKACGLINDEDENELAEFSVGLELNR